MAHQQTIHHPRIERNSQVMVGKPVVRGTRIPVERVIAHLAYNPDVKDVLAAYPELTMDDAKAVLRYACEVVEEEEKRFRAIAAS